MSRVDPMLQALRAANLVLLRAKRERPAGHRSSLNRDHRAELTVEQIEQALRYVATIDLIECPITRRVVAMSMEVRLDGRPIHSSSTIARTCHMSESGLKRYRRSGLEAVFAALNAQKMRMAEDQLADLDA